MSRPALPVGDQVRDMLQTAFRLAPWPTEPGLRRVGHPGAASPVIVTCNYDLTVRRVMRAVSGQDVWVVVAPSGGINVWCAAAGGHLSTHQIVTALKTSGIEDEVAHRHAILPQLAASGVETRQVTDRCGWTVHFGPVSAEDLPRYLETGLEKTEDMRRVRFGLTERLEMAAMVAVPAGLVVGVGAWWLRPEWALPLVGLVVGTALAVFIVYDKLPGPRRLLLGGAIALASTYIAWWAGTTDDALIAAAAASLILTLVFTFDYPGSTPVEGSTFLGERRWQVALDVEACVGALACWEVCPVACFEPGGAGDPIQLANGDRCVRCGACIVQCPEDALYFENEVGERVEPAVIRRYKLNLLGRRTVGT